MVTALPDAERRPNPFVGTRGRRRAAAFLIALGPELAAEVLRLMPEDDIGRLTWEIVGIGQLSSQEREDILQHFYETALGRDFVSVGGLEYAQDMLEKAIGKDRASEITRAWASTPARSPSSSSSRWTRRTW